MKYELLKRSHIKRNIIVAVIVVFILSAIILSFTQAKYRTTESIPLIQGTINFSPSDFNIVAMYLNKGDETVSTKKAPHVGYTLNTEQSTCVVDDEEVENGDILFENGNLTFQNMNYSGTKCSVYFDLIPDSEKPVINSIDGLFDENSITVSVNATDNVGIYYYYFKFDNGQEIRSENNTYTFKNLNSGQNYTISVRVEDAAGNAATSTEEMTAGLKGGEALLAGKNPPTKQTTDWLDGTTYYYNGSTPNNWLKFGNYYWRIVRINSDKTIRIIYQGTSTNDTGTIGNFRFNNKSNDTTYVGFKYSDRQTHGTDINSTVLDNLNSWYQNNLLSLANKIDGNAGFCGDRRQGSGSNYAAASRGNSPSLSCLTEDLYIIANSTIGNKSLSYPIGLITYDEIVLAGGSSSYFNTGSSYWTMAPYGYSDSAATVFCMHFVGALVNEKVDQLRGVRPVINLKSDVQLTGSGTITDPYVVVS